MELSTSTAKRWAMAQSLRPLPNIYSWEEGLEIGTDRLTPVTESYKSPFEFTGTLKKVVLEVEG